MTHSIRSWLTLMAWGLALTWAPAAEPQEKPPVKLSDDEQALLDLTNQVREKEKLPPFKVPGLLVEVARAHSQNMAKQGKLAHELDGKGPTDRVKASGHPFLSVGENVCYGLRISPKQALDIWLNSPPHKKNILEPRYEEIGIGIARDDKGNVYCTQVFVIPPGKNPPGKPGERPEAAAKEQIQRLQEAANKLAALLNEARQKEKVPPLVFNKALMQAAMEHSLVMAGQEKLEYTIDGKKPHHRVPEGSYTFAAHSSKIASSAGVQVADVFAGWMNAKDHREDILSDKYRDVGLGLAFTAKGDVYYTLLLGAAGKPEAKLVGGPLDEKFIQKATQMLVDLTNRAREKEKLPPLKLNDLLTKAAMGHSANMARKEDLNHKLDGKQPPDRVLAVGYDFAVVGENIAVSYTDPPETIVKRWLESPIHREHIMNGEYREIGIGIARNDKGEIYYTQVFGTLRKKR